MELYENIIDLEKPVNETDDYNDFINRRNANKKSIRTKVTTLKENGEVVSEILGTTISNEQQQEVNENKEPISSADGISNDKSISNVQNATDDKSTNSSGNVESSKKDNIKSDTKKDNSTKNENNEDRTVFGMKPIYGYSLITVIALVGIVATVKILKSNKPKVVLN